MAEWSVKPTWKKSIIERNHMHKDGQELVIETGWRWGEFIVYTDDDTPPNLEAGVDMYDCGYESEMVETSDGCWEEHDMDECDEETQAWLEEFFDEGNSWLDLEEHGWSQGDCEMIIDCDMTITRTDVEDGITITTGELDEAQVTETEAKQLLDTPAKWPFERPEEGSKEK